MTPQRPRQSPAPGGGPERGPPASGASAPQLRARRGKPRSHLRSTVSVSVRPRTLCRRQSSRCGSSFRNLTASTSMRRMARILFCKVGNSPAGQEQVAESLEKEPEPQPPSGSRHRTATPSPHLPAADACQIQMGSRSLRSRAERLWASLPVWIFGIRSTVPSGCFQ